jgi:Ni/Co efflux regulator RcnB
MKSLILTLAAAAAVIAPLAAAGAADAQPRGHYERGYQGGREFYGRGYYAPPVRYYPPPVRYYGPSYAWRRGAYLPPGYAGYYISDYGRYGLRPPPRGYRWTRSGNDFLLTAIATGLIFDIVTR